MHDMSELDALIAEALESMDLFDLFVSVPATASATEIVDATGVHCAAV